MITEPELETLINRLLQVRPATNRGASGATTGQDQFLYALAQGTDWSAGRLPLTFQPSPYRVQLKESTFFAASALDCLRLPVLLGDTVTVESTCPSNGTMIHLVITSQGVTMCDPQDSVLSVVIPAASIATLAQELDGPVEPIRRLVHFFSSAEAASLWSVAYSDHAVLNMEQAWRLANLADLGQSRPNLNMLNEEKNAAF